MTFEYMAKTCSRDSVDGLVKTMLGENWEPHLMAGDGNYGGIVIIFRRPKKQS